MVRYSVSRQDCASSWAYHYISLQPAVGTSKNDGTTRVLALPTEILFQALDYLEAQDLCRVGQTCSSIYDLVGGWPHYHGVSGHSPRACNRYPAIGPFTTASTPTHPYPYTSLGLPHGQDTMSLATIDSRSSTGLDAPSSLHLSLRRKPSTLDVGDEVAHSLQDPSWQYRTVDSL